MAFMGMRGTGTWTADQRPQNLRQTILYMLPNGAVPLTAITSMLPSEPTPDPRFSWQSRALPESGGDVTGVYTSATLADAYAGGAVSGSVLYIKAAQAVVELFRPRHTARLSVLADQRKEAIGRVLDKVLAGVNSYIAIQLIETPGANDPVSATYVEIAGNSNAEGDTIPESLATSPTTRHNFTQILRTPLSLTRTAMQTRFLAGDARVQAKAEALEMHGMDIERALLTGVAWEGVGRNGQPERTTRGLIRSIKEFAPENYLDFANDAAWNNKTWLAGGKDFMNTFFANIFSFGDPEKMVLVDSAALSAINALAEYHGTMTISPKITSYGIQVLEWVTPFGIANFKLAPLMNRTKSFKNSMVAFEPRRLRLRVIQETMFKEDKSHKEATGNMSRDGIEEEYLTEIGLEHHFENTGGIARGIGLDNPA